MTMTGKERAALRSECNRLRPTVHVGTEGLSNTVTEALDDALRTRELVKVQLNKTADMSAKDAARQLAGRVKAEVIQTIGKTATFYRMNPQLKRKAGVPPWRE
ncbi:MAG: YhbY family RNA-binding protein [Gemmatimonadetes bacterium]|jgi:RNA-binding protein|nr:YhbY family RNA-binding protein [Gemmatimonadota bacterium]MBP7550781.1 YhbY family RNA-binding protein [Gemmatimonadaceae bacterium]